MVSRVGLAAVNGTRQETSLLIGNGIAFCVKVLAVKPKKTDNP
jgi:hypothetical protein